MPAISRRGLSRFSLATTLVVVASMAACRDGRMSCAGPARSSSGGPPAALGESGGDEQLLAAVADAGTMSQAFGVARSVLYDVEAKDAAALAKLPGRRAFVCAYGLRKHGECGTGAGDDLEQSVRKAATQLRQSADITAKARYKLTLKIDIVTDTRPATFEGQQQRVKSRDVGLDGIWVETGTGPNQQYSYVVPSEMLEQRIFAGKKKSKGLRRKTLVSVLERRNESLGELDDKFDYGAYRTGSWVERDQPGNGEPDIVRLYRTHKWDWEPMGADRLLQFAVWAGDYLMSSVSEDGSIRYQYFVDFDKDSPAYNWLRHGGTVYSMLQLYDRTKFLPYLQAAEKAIAKLMTRCERDERTGPYGGGKTVFVVSPTARGNFTPHGKRLKLGGAGLALLALTTHAEVTGQRERHLEDARAFARFIVASQQESGEFVYFPPYKPDDPVDPKTSLYYPGEVMLGLMKLHALEPSPMWLGTTRRAADWLIDVRDKGKDAKSLNNDHWLMIALSYLYVYTEDKKYLDHSLELARAVEHQYQRRVKDSKQYRDFLGGYYDPPRSTPAATRGEGLVAVLDSCEMAKLDCAWVEKILHDTARHEMLSMYQPDLMYWIRNKAKAFGAFNGGLVDTSIRNDFVQHNMSVMLGYERHLRRRDGVTLPGGPRWTQKAMKGEASFEGIDAPAMSELRADTLRIRGEDR